MSRIGKMPVEIPQGVEAKIEDKAIVFTGSKGTVRTPRHDLVDVKLDGANVVFSPKDESSRASAMWGTLRSLAYNAVQGVANGVVRTLELKGVGFRAALKGSNLEINLGFSHPVVYALPEGVQAVCPSQTEIVVSGCDKQLVGQVAAEIKKLRPVEPYKGKGISYKGQYIRTKEGKKK